MMTDVTGPAAPALRSATWLALALIASLWVIAANGGVLFYYDTADYVERAQALLAQMGVNVHPPEALPAGDPGGPGGPAPGDATEATDGPATLNASRSLVFSLFIGPFVWAGALEGLVVLNAVLVVLAVWLSVRVALRTLAPHLSPAAVTLAAILPAALGSLPFYVAFLMPDLYAAVLLLVVATLVAFAPGMRIWELALAFGFGLLAVTLHLSHLAIGLLLLPLVGVAALLARGPRRWLALSLVLGMVGMGVAEQGALRLAAKAGDQGEVVYTPFLTARLIADGPGLAYLEDKCPDPAIPSCSLLGPLSSSDDPDRLLAVNITFDTSPERGSYALLSGQERRDIAVSQFDFFLDVLRDRPVATVRSLLGNAFQQVTRNSVEMTLQNEGGIARAVNVPGLAFGRFEHGRLTEWRGWLAVADPLHGLLYTASALAVLALVLSRRSSGPLRTFLVMIGLGIVANAIACGGLSTPADRYGARVIWLLPTAAVLAGVVLLAGRVGRAGARTSVPSW